MKSFIQQWRFSEKLNARCRDDSRDNPPHLRRLSETHEVLSQAREPDEAPPGLHDDVMRAVRREAVEYDSRAASADWSPAHAWALGLFLLAALIVAIADMRSPAPNPVEPQPTLVERTPQPSGANALARIDQSVTSVYTNELKRLEHDLASAEAFLWRVGMIGQPDDHSG